MSNGKEIVLKYCKQYTETDIDHIQKAIENGYLIKKERYGELNGCPSSFGLDEFKGLCLEEEDERSGNPMDQCDRCWKKALGVES